MRRRKQLAKSRAPDVNSGSIVIEPRGASSLDMDEDGDCDGVELRLEAVECVCVETSDLESLTEVSGYSSGRAVVAGPPHIDGSIRMGGAYSVELTN